MSEQRKSGGHPGNPTPPSQAPHGTGKPSSPQFEETTQPHRELNFLDNTVDIPLDTLGPLDEDTINLAPGRLHQAPARSASAPDNTGRSAPAVPSSFPSPPSSPSFPSSSPVEPFERRALAQANPEVTPSRPPWWAFWRKSGEDEASPSSQNTTSSSQGRLPWWAFWRKQKQVMQRRKQLSQTGEIPALQWDVKTQPKAKLPVSGPVKEAPSPASKAPQEPSSPPKDRASVVPVRTPQTEGPTALGIWLLLWTGLAIAYSIPLWLTAWPPLGELPAQLGLLRHAAQAADASALLPWKSHSLLYVGLLSDLFLSVWLQWLPASLALPLLLQICMLLTLLGLGFMVRSAGRPRWNLLLGFPFLYAGALYLGDIHFLLALPFVLMGIGMLYRWLALQQPMYGLMAMGLSWLLLLLHLEAYLIFLVAALYASLLLGHTWSDRLFSFVLPGSSLLLFVPWIALLWGTLPDNPATFHMGDLRSRVLGIWDTLTLPTQDGWSDVFALAILLLVWLGIAVANSVPTGSWSTFRSKASTTETPAQRAFFPVLSLSMLLFYLIVPQTWRGFTTSTTTPLVLMMMAWVGWVHITSRTAAGRVLLLATVLVSGGYGYHLFRTYSAYNQEVLQIQTALQRVPPGRRLLVWSAPRSRVFRLRYHQAGGYYMYLRNGVSNLNLQHHLKWRRLSYHAQHRPPLPQRKRIPRLDRWQYVLTSRRPPAALQPHLRLFVQSGPFRIYRKVEKVEK